MSKKTVLRAGLAGLAAAVAFAVTVPASSAQVTAAAAAPVRVMPLGDSITGSPGCWRALLWNQLQSAGVTNVDFVGTLPAQGCGVSHDGDNEGHGGILATNMADANQLVPWLSATRPDIVMMHLGTNDVWSNRSTTTILAAFSKLVDQMRASNPAMKILVAQIIPMNPSTCSECGARTVALNNAIPGWAASRSTSQSPIVVVDQWTGFSTSADTNDGVHPVQSGNVKIANRWLAPLSAAIRGSVPPPVTPPVSTPPSSRPPVSNPPVSNPPVSNPPVSTPPVTTPPPAGACTAAYKVAGQWQGGFQGEVTVRNGGAVPSRSWSVRFSFPNGQTITQIWGGRHTQTGAQVTVTNVDYNGAIAPNGSATFGFIGSWTGTNAAPTVTCTIG
jgi:lysophospholipase L1-like esterase